MFEKIKQLVIRAVNHEGLKFYGANTSWLFSEKIFRMAVGFTVGIYVARQLGPKQYGLLNYAIAFVGIFSIIASFGLDSIVVRELVKYPEKRDKILGSTLAMKFAGFIFMLTVIWITLHFTSNNHSTDLLIIIIAAGYLFQIFQTIEFYFQSKVLSKYVAISQIISWGLVSIGRAFCAWKAYPLVYFAGLEAANMCLMNLGYLFFYTIKINHPFRWRFDSDICRNLLKHSWPVLLSCAAGTIYMRIDQVMIKSMLGDTANGYYSVAAKLSEIWYFFPVIIGSTLLPAVVRSKKVSETHYMNRLQKYYIFMIWASIFICLGMNLISYHLVTILYGKAYTPAVLALVIYMWQLVVMSAMIPFGNWMIAENLQVYSIVFSVFGAIINVVLNFFLIKKIGINGAAIATVAAPLSSFIITGFLHKEMRRQLFMVLKAFLLVDVFRMLIYKPKDI
jgi:O-antigen/teichoic acid export membrane protein